MPDYFVYMMTNHSRTLYTGVTNNLERRVAEHKAGEIEGFTKKYRIDKLAHYESFGWIQEAIAREKEIKAWRRAKKLALIEQTNPHWDDLAENF